MPHLVAIYARISKDDVGDQTSTARQIRLCRQEATQRGWQVVEVYEDVDRSAFTPGVVREGYERLLDGAAARRIDSILVWRLDRLVRSPAEFERLWAVCQRSGVDLVSATEPVDSSDPIGVAIIRLLVTFAGLESEVKSIRLQAKNRELAESGRPPSGRRRYGYSADFNTIVPAEAALLREAAERVLDGESPVAITRDWRARGVLGITGRPWTPTGLRSTLSSRRLVGERVYKGEVVAQDCWPAILDPLTAAEVRSRLASQPGGGQRRPGASLLQGRVRCGCCRTPMLLKGPKDDKRYGCPSPRGCGAVSIHRTALDTWVTTKVLARLEAREPAKNHRLRADRRQVDQLVRSLDASGEQLRELNRRYFVTAELSYPEWVQARDGLLLGTERSTARLLVGRPPRGFPPGRRLGEARQLWNELSLPTRRALIGRELAWVTIHPSPSRNGVWSPERIEPNWLLPTPPNLAADDEPSWPRRLGSQWLYPPGQPPVPQPAVTDPDALRKLDRPLSGAEACVLSGLSPTGLRNHVQSGRLASQEIDGRRTYQAVDVEALRLWREQRREGLPGLSWHEARRYLGVGDSTLRRLVAEGRLVALEEHKRRFTEDALQACIQRCRIYPSESSLSSPPG